jgi:hypothetical protein
MTTTKARTIRRTRAADLRRAARAEAARRQEERDEAVGPPRRGTPPWMALGPLIPTSPPNHPWSEI